MWITLTRKAKWYDGVLHPEETLSREQALRMYTANNAYILRREHEIGSLETGKLADFVVLDRDFLGVSVDEVQKIEVIATYLGGKAVYQRP